MKLEIFLKSIRKPDFDLALKKIIDLANKKGLSISIKHLKTKEKKQASGYILKTHRVIITISKPTDSFVKELKSLRFQNVDESMLLLGTTIRK